jgi:hypothetical protein
MTEIDEVLSFSRDFINNRSCRTPERKAKIRKVIKQITGESLGKSCGTCYIEALFKILKLHVMSQYELKRGYVAQFDTDAFRDIKAFTNENLLNDPDKYDPICAEWARQNPAKAATFIVRSPGPPVPYIPPSITIIPPVKKELDPADLIKSVLEPDKVIKPKTSKPRK